MRRAWFWLLYRLGIRKPPSFTDMVLTALRNRPAEIGANVTRNNALYRRMRHRP